MCSNAQFMLLALPEEQIQFPALKKQNEASDNLQRSPLFAIRAETL